MKNIYETWKAAILTKTNENLMELSEAIEPTVANVVNSSEMDEFNKNDAVQTVLLNVVEDALNANVVVCEDEFNKLLKKEISKVLCVPSHV